MNKIRKNRLEKILNEIENLRDEIGEIKDDEQEAFDNLPESIQCSERGEQMEMNVNDLDDIYDSLDTVTCDLSDFLENC